MKQKKLGEQTTNWHKSFDLRQSYIREQKGKINKAEIFQLADDYDCYPYYEDFNYCDCCNSNDTCPICGYLSCVDVQVYKLSKLLKDDSAWQQIQHRISSTLPLQQKQPKNQQVFKENSQKQPEKSCPSSDQFANKLSEHIQELVSAHNLDEPLPTAISQAINSKEDLEVLQNIVKRLSSTILTSEPILYSVLFSPFWIRSPRDFRYQDLDKQKFELSLIDHLFVKYPVPQFLYKAFNGMAGENMKWVCWFIILAQGGSLLKFTDHFDWTIAKKLQHYLQNVPSDFVPINGCMYAEILRLGGSRKEFDRLHLNHNFAFDPTSRPPLMDRTFLPFWQDLVKWLAKNRELITDENVTQLLNWGLHKFIEANRFSQTFSLTGRSAARVLEDTAQYLDEINRSYDSYKATWKKHGLDWEWVDTSSQTWSFVELASSLELIEEGRAMHHCVSGYARYCTIGYIAIISLKCNNVRHITIELVLANKKIAQAKGYGNRQATSQEQTIINKWFNEIVLVIT